MPHDITKYGRNLHGNYHEFGPVERSIPETFFDYFDSFEGSGLLQKEMVKEPDGGTLVHLTFDANAWISELQHQHRMMRMVCWLAAQLSLEELQRMGILSRHAALPESRDSLDADWVLWRLDEMFMDFCAADDRLRGSIRNTGRVR